jgi:NitT/TauT family transport system substrate-binding protein
VAFLNRRSVLRLAAAAPAAGLPLRARAQSSARIRVGTTLNDSYVEPFYAQDQGFFERAGLNVDVRPFPNGSGVTAALAGNAIDVGITNPISLANAADHGLPFAFFASAALYNRDEVEFCVAADSPIKSAKDLEGKIVGTTALRDSNSLHIVAWIDANGGDSTKVQLVEVPFPAMAPAIVRGTVVAAPIAEPYLSAALKNGGIRVLGHTMDVFGKEFMVGGWFAERDWIAANMPLLRRFAGVIYETARWANTNPAASAAILSKYSKLDLNVVLGMNRARYGESFSLALFQRYLDLGYKYKYINRQFKATDLLVNVEGART